ncbi:MAG: HAMP domain-containing histidine kinase [Chloroflexi bacterium]|jgi:signal transduction histidine kinase|nr:HAMP domain-containing histidine kinase [Chloroflexota bacterium]MBT4073642.1 HAMP domain-containing histidine kinase [Chloroflexota bacterium]MBT4515283.1 HAMP domain-containing histidine kinase [Chloroflexota bacterium]MBT6682108.1 HAMP domain-containing histidine kinase [Chloroflexota bacterium]
MFRRVIIRLAALNAAVLILTVGLALVGVFFGARYGLQKDVDRDLKESARVMAASEATRMNIETFGGPPGTAPAPLTYVFDAEGSLLTGVPSREGDLPDFASMRVALAGGEDIRDASGDDDSRTISLPVLRDGQIIGVVQVGRSIESQREFIGLLGRLLIGVGVLATFVAAGGGVFLASRAMRPIRRAFERQRGFIADASHELRTPIAVVRADADALARGLEELSEPDAQLLKDMQSESDHMALLIDRLVELARLDATQINPVVETFDLKDLITDSVRSAQVLVGERDTQLRMSERDPDPVSVRADLTHVRTILLSLLENAITHGSEPNTVTVELARTGDAMSVSVTDTGGGIPVGQADQVFERFYRGDPSRTRNAGGVGLGLTIARSLVELNGGQIEIANNPGIGMAVNFSLPLADETGHSP